VSIPNRITHSMMSNRLLADVRRASSEMARTSEQVTSGKRISSAADDPLGTERSLRLRSSLDQLKGDLDGLSSASGWTTAGDAALSSINDIVHRARELTMKASNGTLQQSDRTAIALELEQLVDQVKTSANARYGDQYIFSGQSSDTPPYTIGAVDAYAGDGLAVMRPIGAGQAVQVNVPGVDVLGTGGGDGKLIDTMRTAIARMQSGTPADLAALRSDTLNKRDDNLDQVLAARSQLGVTATRIELATDRVKDVQLATTSELADVEETDIAQALIRLSSQKTAYQAALSSGASVIQPSLLDFLR